MAQSLTSFTAEELPALAMVFALALAEPMTNDDALLLASFLSTIGSDIGLFVSRRSRETVETPVEAPVEDIPDVTT